MLTGIVLRALERLPLVTDGIGIALTLSQRSDDGSSGYYSLTIDEESVTVSTGEVIYSPAIGGDRESRDIVTIGIGWREGDADFIEIEDWIAVCSAYAEEPHTTIDFDDYAESEVDWHRRNHW